MTASPPASAHAPRPSRPPRARRAALLLLPALAALAAPPRATGQAPPDTTAPAPPAAPPGRGPLLVDRVIAVVDEEAILQSELEREVAIWKLEQSQEGRDAGTDEAAVRAEVLQRLVESKLMIAAAREAEIEVDDEEIQRDVDGNVDELVRHFGSQAALAAELARNGMNLADYRTRTANQVRDRRYMSAVVNRFVRSHIEVREDEVAAYWAAHGDEVPAAPDSVRLASILVPVEAAEAAQREAQRKVGLALQELGEGKAFAEVARRRSEDPSAQRGGLLGTFRRGELSDRRLEEAVWSLRVGETSRPVLTDRGVHVLRLDAAEGDARTVSQIFFPLAVGAAEVEAARQRAAAAHARLVAGEAFAKVAAEVSADPNAAQGGDVGLFPVSDLSERFQAALAGLGAGQFTEPVQTPAGFYVFLVRERLPGRKPGYDEVRESVRRAVEAEKVEAELAKYVQELRGRFYVDIRD